MLQYAPVVSSVKLTLGGYESSPSMVLSLNNSAAVPVKKSQPASQSSSVARPANACEPLQRPPSEHERKDSLKR